LVSEKRKPTPATGEGRLQLLAALSESGSSAKAAARPPHSIFGEKPQAKKAGLSYKDARVDPA
jgi:molybdenum-dependent DNA-binding transcriptional regulator ModE